MLDAASDFARRRTRVRDEGSRLVLRLLRRSRMRRHQPASSVPGAVGAHAARGLKYGDRTRRPMRDAPGTNASGLARTAVRRVRGDRCPSPGSIADSSRCPSGRAPRCGCTAASGRGRCGSCRRCSRRCSCSRRSIRRRWRCPDMPYLVAGPLPMPSGPWQTAQLIWNSMRPRFTDAESAGTGFGMLAIAAIVCGIGSRSYSKPGAAVPRSGPTSAGCRAAESCRPATPTDRSSAAA